MELTVYLNFSLAAQSSIAKRQTIHRIQQSLQPYHFEAAAEEGRFVVKLSSPNWPDGVFQLLDFAQQLGRHWRVSGKIRHGFDAFSSEICITGVAAASMMCENPFSAPRMPPQYEA